VSKILEVKNLNIAFGFKKPFKAVEDVSFNLSKGKTLGIVGESGSGKSVLASSILSLLPQNAKITGDIEFMGKKINGINEKELRKIRGNQIAMVFQDHMSSLNPVMTVGKQIREVVMLHQKLNKIDAKQKAIKMLELVNLPVPKKIYSKYPHELSGGMRQRIMIGMALSCEPQILICDEPTTALDVTIQVQILKLIENLKLKFKISIIFISHDLGVIFEMADEIMVMYAGKIMEFGNVEKIFKNPLHPYTQALFSAILISGQDKKKDHIILKNTLNLERVECGCKFSLRCPYYHEDCKNKSPELKEYSKDHFCACIKI
jgi:oligopeptide/dipeptide ABC transporter ATP-binding protein